MKDQELDELRRDLEAIRERRSCWQDVADLIGCRLASIVQWRSGKHRPTRATRERIRELAGQA